MPSIAIRQDQAECVNDSSLYLSFFAIDRSGPTDTTDTMVRPRQDI
jgi:hypothetical protein